MAKSFVAKIESVEFLSEVIRNKLLNDLPKGDLMVEQEIRQTTSLILEYLLIRKELEAKGLNVDEFLEKFDFLEECQRLILDFMKNKVFTIISKDAITNLEVISDKGDLVIKTE
jgi:hypothetical protein